MSTFNNKGRHTSPNQTPSPNVAESLSYRRRRRERTARFAGPHRNHTHNTEINRDLNQSHRIYLQRLYWKIVGISFFNRTRWRAQSKNEIESSSKLRPSHTKNPSHISVAPTQTFDTITSDHHRRRPNWLKIEHINAVRASSP